MSGVTPATETLVIRKYGNRRLYRTDESRYVTLEELTQLVHEGVVFSVVDAKTGRDITSLVLAQVILDEERAQEETVYPAQLLRQLIRMSDPSLAAFVQEHLPRLLDLHRESELAAARELDRVVINPVEADAGSLLSGLRSVHSQIDTLLNSLEDESRSVQP